MIAGVVMIAMAAAATLFVLAPLRHPSPSTPRETNRNRLPAERDALYRAIRDLDLDRATGKISDTDYADLAARYRARALDVLRRFNEEDDPPGPAERGAVAGPGGGSA